MRSCVLALLLGPVLTEPQFRHLEKACSRLESDELIERFGCSTVTPLEFETLDSLNALRESAGAPPLSLANSMQVVARLHLSAANQDAIEEGCAPLHSWTDGPLAAETKYNICCYPKVYDCMWDKPQEIFGEWVGFGYELGALLSKPWTSGNEIINKFQASPEHLDILVNAGEWTEHRWTAVGIAIEEGLAFMWLSDGLKAKTFGFCEPPGGAANEAVADEAVAVE
eukprot:Blabericola_migrator_1__9364@NODE_504_length_7967_cov_171_363291_g386_i0_p4_GENE_NODE_504_length_7967_cov_171_363291_g386_i0NODE_504_length_7967_cov_171_363291_g386_i0_p4_ORF_typecomplete_len226_score36_35CAP/PF00188_26/0_056_NODE_504_length_7967_cov_171_363291_g386_i042374914